MPSPRAPSPSPEPRPAPPASAEHARLDEDASRAKAWKRWGPYLSERQWGTVREDYSDDGSAWDYLPHEHARSRAYRWGEDGLLGLCDRQGRLCLAFALWNGKDPYLKERLFGLTNQQGNHGEDVKEEYFYVDATPTHSYGKSIYRYPLDAFPYERLVKESAQRGVKDAEPELRDLGVFDGNRFVDVVAEHAKAGPDDVLVRVTLENRSAEPASLVVLPTLWFRNLWSWGRVGDGHGPRPRIRRADDALGGVVTDEHASLAPMRLFVAAPAGQPGGGEPRWLFTENETNVARLFQSPNPSPYVKDAFHAFVVGGDEKAVNPAEEGTKVAALLRLSLPARGSTTLSRSPAGRPVEGPLVLRLRLRAAGLPSERPFDGFDDVLAARIAEADAFYRAVLPTSLDDDERRVARAACAGLLHTKQFFHYDVAQWIAGDPAQPPPPPDRRFGRNATWTSLLFRDVLSMPDKWEYPWFAAWDLAFHMIPFARLDPEFTKDQLVLFLREWTMSPSGQIPAYEWALSDVNPPVHAWACWRTYKRAASRHARDRAFLARTFQKLVINFTWWVNRKDAMGRNLFSGGFLGLDNVGVFDRNKPLPRGGHLEQADGTAWMAFFASTMLAMALELAGGGESGATVDPAYEDMASKFFEHYVAIADAMNGLGGTGLWDEEDGFYYDQVAVDGRRIPLRVRSIVGLVPLFASEVVAQSVLERLPGFTKRLVWFRDHRPDLTQSLSWFDRPDDEERGHLLLAIPSRERLVRLLGYVLDESEFLSPYGVRSLSRHHREHPFTLRLDGESHTVGYEPGESTTRMFGGNSNWRGPVWLPMNYLLIEALERWHHVYGDEIKVECPTGSGRLMNLAEVAMELSRRLTRLFLRDEKGRRPCFGGDERWQKDPAWRDLLLFHEYFDGDTGRGLGAAHQTGWTALLVPLLEHLAHARERGAPR